VNTQGNVSQLLQDWSDGNPAALEKLMPYVHAELHRIAGRYMAGEHPMHTLQASALINEAYIRLVGWKGSRLKNRSQFFAMSAQLMRRILVDHARNRDAHKRGGAANRVTLDTAVLAHAGKQKSQDVIDLDEAIGRLAEFDPRKSKVVELRVFGGLEVEEVAEVLGIAVITVKRDWKLALAWLRQELET
jgi:RNA polymerase sigma factor (TIGR02999 family)